jgi:hypothetical protein
MASLPATVAMTASNGRNYNLSGEWVSDHYDGNAPGAYTFSFKVQYADMPEYLHLDPALLKVNVTVLPP